jgi:hypothetical protein
VVRDEKVSRRLAVLDAVWDPATHADRPGDLPADAQELEKVQRIRTVEGTETARAALDAGDWPTLKHLAGDPGQRADISGIKAIGRLDELITGPAPVIVILGEMGAGKTELAKLVGQRWRHHYGGKVASNIETLDEVDDWTDREGQDRSGWIANFPNFKEWVRQDGPPVGNDQTPKLAILDELSSSASGTGKQGHQVRTKMGPLIFKIRKYGGALVIIGHDPSSIHPLAWRVGKIIEKEDKKEARVAERIKNGEIRDYVGDPITGIPRSDWGANDKEPSSWSWTRPDAAGGDDEELTKDEVDPVAIYTAIRAKEDGLSDREAAKYTPYSRSWVNSRWREYNDEGLHQETLDTVEAVIA